MSWKHIHERTTNSSAGSGCTEARLHDAFIEPIIQRCFQSKTLTRLSEPAINTRCAAFVRDPPIHPQMNSERHFFFLLSQQISSECRGSPNNSSLLIGTARVLLSSAALLSPQ